MLTQEVLKEYLNYDPESGIFIWIKPSSSAHHVTRGKPAGTLDESGYMRITLFGKRYKSHRLAWFYIHGIWPKVEIDHRNLVRDDNRLDNLREADLNQQACNKSRYKNNTSGAKGVSWNKYRNRWVAYVNHQGMRRYLGLFITLEEANQRVHEHRLKLHQDFANLG
ncbi:MAG: HNH endonuclease [Alphaproteobacteria bacterium]|nr:HNH endonuclease [Alphaproteobacteria bacterium]